MAVSCSFSVPFPQDRAYDFFYIIRQWLLEGVTNPRDLLQLVKELLCSSFVIGELSTEQELAQFDLIE